MSHDPLLDKMDALLKKHRGDNDTDSSAREFSQNDVVDAEAVSPPPDAWLPVLTDVVVMGSVTVDTSDKPGSASHPAQNEVITALKETDLKHEQSGTQEVTDSAAISDTLAEQLMGELEPKLAELLQNKVATEIRNSLDDTVSALLAQLDVNIREIVREAVNEKLANR